MKKDDAAALHVYEKTGFRAAAVNYGRAPFAKLTAVLRGKVYHAGRERIHIRILLCPHIRNL